MGYLDDVELVQVIPQKEHVLSGKATSLLKGAGKKKRVRRGKGGVKRVKKQRARELFLKEYKQQKKQRAQMFKDFERLIGE